MEDRQLSVPHQHDYEYSLDLAYKIASAKLLARVDEIEQQCARAGAQYRVADSEKLVILQYLNQSYKVSLPVVQITAVENKESVPLRAKVLMLHYLTQARGTPLTGKLITYKELPNGLIYFPTFSKRAIKPLVDYFGKEPDRLLDVTAKLGGRKTDYGDIAVTLNAFRYVPLTLVLWQGDEEFAPAGNIMFDSTITDYLATEDVTVLCESLAWRLVRMLKG